VGRGNTAAAFKYFATVKQEVAHGNDSRKTRTQSPIGSICAASRTGRGNGLDDLLADYLAWEEQDYEKSVEAIRRGNEDVLAGRTRPAEEVFQELRLKYGLPR